MNIRGRGAWASGEASGGEARGASEKIRDLADGVLPEQQHQEAGETHAEPAVGRGAVAEEVEVEVQVLGLEALLLRLLDEHGQRKRRMCAQQEFALWRSLGGRFDLLQRAAHRG